MRRYILVLVTWLGLVLAADAQSIQELQVGHWVELKGELDGQGRFEVESLEVLPPDDSEVLIGTVTEVDPRSGSFRVLGQRVATSARTKWKDADLGSISGKRVKVQGHYRGPSKFSARDVSARGAGSDRIVGRLDHIDAGDGGRLGRVMGFQVWFQGKLEFENKGSFSGIALAPYVEFETAAERGRESDDYIPGSYRLADDLYFGVLLDSKSEHRDNFDLDSDARENVDTSRLSVRAQFLWTPTDDFTGLFSPRYEVSWRKDQRFSAEKKGDPSVQELWAYWRAIGGSNMSVQFGRQLFRDQREWLYKDELDGLRVVWRREHLRVEASATTVLTDGSERDEHSEDLMLYVSNNDELQHLAAYVIDRRDKREVRDYPLHFGVRALGTWIPDTKAWIEGSIVRGYQGDVDLRGHAIDAGITWSPSFDLPVYFTAAWAQGSGDDASSSGVSEAFRQTGFQRNNGKLGGVTSFRYYGELLDPELSNLSIATLGLGVRLARRTSLDFVWHAYSQDEAAGTLLNAGLKDDPDGVHRSLGHEVDVIFGSKAYDSLDFEIVGAWYSPGAAFPDADDAWLASFQVRYRF